MADDHAVKRAATTAIARAIAALNQASENKLSTQADTIMQSKATTAILTTQSGIEMSSKKHANSNLNFHVIACIMHVQCLVQGRYFIL